MAPGNRDMVTLHWRGEDWLEIRYPESLRPVVAADLIGDVKVTFETVDLRFECGTEN